MKWVLTFVAVTVTNGQTTGSSAANPLIANNAGQPAPRIIGAYPVGVATTTGFGLVDTVSIAANGAVTVTTRAVVATADLNMIVVIGTPYNG